MKPPTRFLLMLGALLVGGTLGAQVPPPPLPPGSTPAPAPLRPALATSSDPDATLVVFNQNDEDSKLLADFYAEKRGIPHDQVVGLNCPVRDEISRQEYDDTIADPLRQMLTDKGWWKLREPGGPGGPVESNQFRYVALMRGMPLKIAPVAAYLGDKPAPENPIGSHNEAAVDSELAMLGYRARVISGVATNPYFHSNIPIREARRPDLLLVCRLDAPTPAVVRRMIVDSINTEETGLRGFAYIDARGIAATDKGLFEGDEWLLKAALDLRRAGLPVILDNGPAMFPEGYPMRSCALYLGWYNQAVSGPFARPGFRFVPGAIAVHIHSFSALSIHDPKAWWVGPLLDLGAAATLGNVYEPYLALTPHLDIFEEHLRKGFNFAESAYASQRVLSWMTTFVGDPLYRPFSPLPAPGKGAAAEWDAYRRASARWDQDPKATAVALQNEAARLKSGVIWEGLGLLQAGAINRQAAIDAFEQARKVYSNPEDILRTVIHELIQLHGMGHDQDVINLAKKQAGLFPTQPAVAVIQLLAPEAFPNRQP